jgi:D-alanyl-D-alanine carboxypeptidase (penicillin-binding protein 5/6)
MSSTTCSPRVTLSRPTSRPSSTGAGETVAEAETFGAEKGRVALVTRKPVRLMLPRGNGGHGAGRHGLGGVERHVEHHLLAAGDLEPADLAALEVGTGWFRQALSRITSKS